MDYTDKGRAGRKDAGFLKRGGKEVVVEAHHIGFFLGQAVMVRCAGEPRRYKSTGGGWGEETCANREVVVLG